MYIESNEGHGEWLLWDMKYRGSIGLYRDYMGVI